MEKINFSLKKYLNIVKEIKNNTTSRDKLCLSKE